MDLLFLSVVVPLFGTPVLAALAWWVWLRTDRDMYPPPRPAALHLARIAVSVNVVLFWTCIAIAHLATEPQLGWGLKRFVEDYVSGGLAVAGLIGAIFGKGPGRLLVGLAAAMGAWIWVPVGIL